MKLKREHSLGIGNGEVPVHLNYDGIVGRILSGRIVYDQPLNPQPRFENGGIDGNRKCISE